MPLLNRNGATAKKSNSKKQTNSICKAQIDKSILEMQRRYQGVFGDRWESRLLSSLLHPTNHVALLNPYLMSCIDACECDLIKQMFQDWNEMLPGVYCRETRGDLPQPISIRGYHSHYFLDGASLLPALTLAPCLMDCDNDSCTVVDMCAAPGGKSLMFSSILLQSEEPSALLIANEIDKNRRTRLRRVVEAFFPSDWLCEISCISPSASSLHIAIGGIDAQTINKNRSISRIISNRGVDFVLLDAPCSSERHFLQQALSQSSSSIGTIWSSGRVRRDAKLQLKLLKSAVDLIRLNSNHNNNVRRVVYSTCSLAPEQNDGVIERLLEHKRYKDAITIVSARECVSMGIQCVFNNQIVSKRSSDDDQHDDRDFAEKVMISALECTKHGAIMLPDRGFAWGPIYFAVIQVHVHNDADDDDDTIELNDSS